MSAQRRISDYPALSNHMSDLRACSLDDNGNTEDSHLFEHEGFSAVCIDAVMRGYCGEQGAARSVDALYVGECTDNWDSVIDLIEFKNGNLYERHHAPVSSKIRSEFKNALMKRIEKVIESYVMALGDKTAECERELRGAVDQCVKESFGKPAERRGSQQSVNASHGGDSFVLESVKTKALSSAFLLLSILGESADYIQNNVDFILVYNPSSLSHSKSYCGSGDNRVELVPSLDKTLVGGLAKCAGRPVSRFGLKSSLGVFFHDVLTLTSDELREHLTAR